MLEEQNAIRHLEDCLKEEEALLLQKSRVNWLHLGDGNNKYFHSRTQAKWNVNKILAIQNDNNETVFGHKSCADISVQFFENTLGASSSITPCDLDGLNLNMLTEQQVSSLTFPVTNELIFDTLRRMKKNKAPGPDCFPVEFFLAT